MALITKKNNKITINILGIKITFHTKVKKIESLYPKNKELENIHKGERCFIVGTGTSILEQDLTLLKNEHVIALSQLYNHKDYPTINPEYHIFSGINHHRLGEKILIEYYKEVESKINPNTKLFINYTDKNDIEKQGLLKNWDIYYCEFTKNINNINGFAADKALYSSQSISIMAIQIAIIMGFKEIYLVGCDHDWILKALNKDACSFYNPKQSVFGKNGYVENWNNFSFEDEFLAEYKLWKTYRLIKEYLEKNNIHTTIYYATKNGLLDVFEKVEYEDLFK